MTFTNLTIEYIINWCKDNNQTAWLKEFASQEVEFKKYPRKKIVGEDSKVSYTANKDAAPTIRKARPSFIQIKTEFCRKFMLELLNKKTTKPAMYDLIDAL